MLKASSKKHAWHTTAFFCGQAPGAEIDLPLLKKQLQSAIRNPSMKQRLTLALTSNPTFKSELLKYAETLCSELSMDNMPIDISDNARLLQQTLWLLEYRAMMGLVARASNDSYLSFCHRSPACQYILQTGNPLWLKEHLIRLYNTVIEIQESLHTQPLSAKQQENKRHQLRTCIELILNISPSIENVGAHSLLFKYFLMCLQHYSLAAAYAIKESDTYDQVNANKALLTVGATAQRACAITHTIGDDEQIMLVFLTLGSDLFQGIPVNGFEQLAAAINAQLIAFQNSQSTQGYCGAAAR